MPMHEFAQMRQAFAAFWFGAMLAEDAGDAIIAAGERAAHTFFGQSVANTKIHDTQRPNTNLDVRIMVQLRMIVNYEIVAPY